MIEVNVTVQARCKEKGLVIESKECLECLKGIVKTKDEVCMSFRTGILAKARTIEVIDKPMRDHIQRIPLNVQKEGEGIEFG